MAELGRQTADHRPRITEDARTEPRMSASRCSRRCSNLRGDLKTETKAGVRLVLAEE